MTNEADAGLVERLGEFAGELALQGYEGRMFLVQEAAAALAVLSDQPVAVPVAWRWHHGDGWSLTCCKPDQLEKWQPLFAEPPTPSMMVPRALAAPQPVSLPAGVEQAAQALCDYAWSAVVTDCTESAEYLNKLVEDLRKALAARPIPEAQGVEKSLDWAVERWNAEVANRPLVNVHRRSLDTTWRQVMRHFGGDPEALCGPSHDELVDAHPEQFAAQPASDAAPTARRSGKEIIDGWEAEKGA